MSRVNNYTAADISIRPARIGDVRAIKDLVDSYAGKVLLAKDLVTLYEDVQEFWVAEARAHDTPRIVGCGAVHVLWEDLAELRTIAVDPSVRGCGVGYRIVSQLIAYAVELGLRRLFVLTFETKFFTQHGFAAIAGTPVTPDVYAEMRRSADEGVAEFLDLPYVKPNTFGNTRMLLELIA